MLKRKLPHCNRTAKKRVTKKEATEVAKQLKINFKKVPFTFYSFHRGMNVELEHGCIGKVLTNVTNDDLLKTGKIALAHLKEGANYYTLLKKLETRLSNSMK